MFRKIFNQTQNFMKKLFRKRNKKKIKQNEKTKKI